MQAIGLEMPNVWTNMGWALRQDNDPDGARSSFQATLRMSRRNGDRSGMASAWRAWPRTRATGTGRPRSTASRKPSSTPLGNRGRSLKRAIAGTASARCAPTSAKTSSTEPMPWAWR
jgi:hypothetical protein